MEDFDLESNLDMTEVWPPVLPHAQNAIGTTRSRGRGGGAKSTPPTPSVSPRKTNFGGIDGSIGSSSSNDRHTSSDNSKRNDTGDLPALVWRPTRDLEVFSKLPALQSGRTRSQWRGLTMTASYADALLAYAMRTA